MPHLSLRSRQLLLLLGPILLTFAWHQWKYSTWHNCSGASSAVWPRPTDDSQPSAQRGRMRFQKQPCELETQLVFGVGEIYAAKSRRQPPDRGGNQDLLQQPTTCIDQRPRHGPGQAGPSLSQKPGPRRAERLRGRHAPALCWASCGITPDLVALGTRRLTRQANLTWLLKSRPLEAHR